MHFEKIKCSCGDSFADTIAYIDRSISIHPRTGRIYNYSRQSADVVAIGLVGWRGDRASLIADATSSERRWDACEGREIIVALPEENDDEENLRLLAACANFFVEEYGVAAAYALHRPPKKGNGKNKHGHVAISARETKNGLKLGAKTRILDSLKTGGDEVRKFRSWWCATLNASLKAQGFDANIECRSFEELGIKQAPIRKHQGVGRTAAQRHAEARLAVVAAGDRPSGPLPTPAPNLSLATPAQPTGTAHLDDNSQVGEVAASYSSSKGLRPPPEPRLPSPTLPRGLRPLPIPRPAQGPDREQ